MKTIGIDMTDWLYKNEYVPFAPEEAGTVNIHHCKSGKDNDKLFITRCEDGLTILAYCHHCGKRGYHNQTDSANIKTLLAAKENRKVLAKVGGKYEHKLPRDCKSFGSDWPTPARVWVRRYGITKRELDDYGICYSESLGRVVMPVYDGDGLALYQARKIFDFDDGPKYLTYHNRNGSVWFSHLPSIRTLVICEDILSAIKVSRLLPSCAVLGTSISDKSFNIITKQFDEFIIFMDDDNIDVRTKQLTLKNRLEMFGKVRIVHTKGKDAKEHTNQQLEDILL